MNVLILYPELDSFRHKSLGVSLLAGIIKREEHAVELFETSMYDQTQILPVPSIKDKEITFPYWFKRSKMELPAVETFHIDVIDAFNEKLEKCRPDLILVSSTFLSHPLGVNLVSKSKAKDMTVIFGGIHCTVTPESAFAHSIIKYLHLGEAEKSLPEILKKVAANESLDNCPNLWVKMDDGTIKKNNKTPMITDLDELPYYNWEMYSNYQFERLYEGQVYRMGDFSTSRGCVRNCTYCFNRQLYSSYGHKSHFIRRYSVPRVIEELEYLKNRYNLTFIKFHDSDFLNKSSDYLNEFSARYRERINLPNTVNACVEQITEKKANYLVRMNCRSLAIGLESGNEEIRKNVLNRHYSNDLFVEKISILHRTGLRVSVPAMIGLPGESRDNIIETIHVCKKAKVSHVDFCIFFPFPNMVLTENAIDKGCLKRDQPLYHLVFGLESALKSEHFTHEELRNILRCATLYFRLPQDLWPVIEYAEKHNTNDGHVWQTLRELYFIFLETINSGEDEERAKRRQAILETV